MVELRSALLTYGEVAARGLANPDRVVAWGATLGMAQAAGPRVPGDLLVEAFHQQVRALRPHYT